MERDTLTGLYYFDTFIRVANEILAKNEYDYCIVSTDFSNFKYINKIYGFESGDRLLREFVHDCCEQTPSCLAACRPYSDHIVGLYSCSHLTREETCKIIDGCNVAFVKKHAPNYPLVGFHLNTGIYFIEDTNENSAAAIDKANIARRSIKGVFNVNYAVFTETLRTKSEKEQGIIPLFEKALEKDLIQIYLQPKINVDTQEIVGAEALSRLIDADGNIIPPDSFIPILEKTGKIVDLDFYVIQKIAGLLKKWKDNGKELIPVSINLSKLNFYRDNLVNEIVTSIEPYGIDPQYIEFEVTESVFISEAELLIKHIEELRKFGYKISVDDFGAGYSSLSLIGVLPVDIIKLDKSFIKSSLQTSKGRSIIKSMIEMLQRINLDIICEGIEVKEEEDIVSDYGCHEVQGFLHDKPLPLDVFEDKYI